MNEDEYVKLFVRDKPMDSEVKNFIRYLAPNNQLMQNNLYEAYIEYLVERIGELGLKDKFYIPESIGKLKL